MLGVILNSNERIELSYICLDVFLIAYGIAPEISGMLASMLVLD